MAAKATRFGVERQWQQMKQGHPDQTPSGHRQGREDCRQALRHQHANEQQRAG